ncbi:VOC family protein [Pelomonas aquatica]|jgi:catechol 2,3-dioxygenase-like lactoylglutathione lyase family enzyme|uniref:VOC family protein n=1 Tax=Pelomonas aquatica TaxID=431058 RepID=A0A9X4R5K0_9BURK|nr:VOC family protein [Pelomonas aquatica]MCY4752793.1 VOC family protein [Pelomonas aquatica]MDG0864507.1 VOC family protein [Pelomonas aquatica]
MIDHLSLTVGDYAKSKAFYLAALAPTGHSRLVELPAAAAGQSPSAGFCHADGSDLWIRQGRPIQPPVHIAFRVPTRAAVDGFHKAALAAGGTDNGPPGLRPNYHPSYYGAFVLDPDGNNIEAVCHEVG